MFKSDIFPGAHLHWMIAIGSVAESRSYLLIVLPLFCPTIYHGRIDFPKGATWGNLVTPPLHFEWLTFTTVQSVKRTPQHLQLDKWGPDAFSLGDVYMCLSLRPAERVMIRWTSPSCGREMIEKWGMSESHPLYLGSADHLRKRGASLFLLQTGTGRDKNLQPNS